MKTQFSLVALASLVVAVGFDDSADAAAPMGGVAQAQQTTTTLTNALVAAVASISDAAPAMASPLELEAGFEAVSLLVPECQDAYRLVDATGEPIDPANVPQDSFERRSLQSLLAGAPVIQEIMGGELRTLVPLTSDMHPNCATCHTNYDLYPAGTVVGAASIRVGL